MHIAHIQGIFSPEHGGPAQSLTNYGRGQAAAGHRVEVWALEGFPQTSPAIRLPPPVEMRVFSLEAPARLGRSSAMRRAIERAEPSELYHLHGTWLRAMYYGATEARHRKRPYVLELMGMYEPYGLQQKWLQKRITRWWFQDRILHHASCLHVSSRQEGRNLRALGFKAPIATIPVGVVLDPGQPALRVSADEAPWRGVEARPYVLYLARIDAKKGVEVLLQAWACLQASGGLCSEANSPETGFQSQLARRGGSDWKLLIAGTGQSDYVARCKRAAQELGIGESVVWAGQVTEAQKSWAYTHAALYVLPTFSENFGNTVAEALAHETPVVTTTATPWEALVTRRCGWIASPDVSSVAAAMREAMALSARERNEMGKRGRKWVEEEFSLCAVIKKLDQVYRWVTQRGPQPSCVVTH